MIVRDIRGSKVSGEVVRKEWLRLGFCIFTVWFIVGVFMVF